MRKRGKKVRDMADRRLIRISRLMSLILRHQPAQFGVWLDAEGYTTMPELVRALRRSYPDASSDDVHRVIATIEPDKARFSLAGTDVRANYGHSLRERIEQPRVLPPPILLHGTSEDAARAILAEGIRPMRRQYVHLTTNLELATRVGGRHGKPRVLEVEALRASEAGVAFFRANDAFWLADRVPAEFVRRSMPAKG
jgi:putative RNA 2'-phosphotransferase